MRPSWSGPSRTGRVTSARSDVSLSASAVDASSMLWIYRVTIDEVFDRGRSARAIDRRGAEEPVLRDYFIARSPQAGLVWIYRERPRNLAQDLASSGQFDWYLQGLYA